MLLWRQHAGAAHSLPWINTGKAESLDQLAEGGFKGPRDGFLCRHCDGHCQRQLMINEAIRLYEKRASTPPR